ncbi:MAG TPA: Tol-Pal system beta propeller repeat protein TolB [Thermoanaerobaculia bacterium]|nr:Tol-Pal system beta propeller repeat protein TolB [Thermoanaerobaculia bacterium]
MIAIGPRHVLAQGQVSADITKGLATVGLAVPFPQLDPTLSPDVIGTPFFASLQRDLAISGVFRLVALPPYTAPSIETAETAGAQAFLQLSMKREGEEIIVESRLFDVKTKTVQIQPRRYRGTEAALTRMAHTLANDLVRYFNGQPGIFMTQIAFVSSRDGAKEIYLMDYDGSSQRRITSHRTLALNPDWSPDNDRLVYTAFGKESSDLYIVNRRGGGRLRISTGVGLNTSATFSPDGKEIAFVGSVRGNPDIYVIRDDGTGMRRLTSASSIESTPSWSPTGRQIAFTSSRNGTPQIFVMDAEGSNVRRISFDGDWNDDAVWSPKGDLLAYTSRVDGRFQIRIMDMASTESRIIAGEGSNEQPAWSPDGRFIVFMSNRSGKWQIYRVGSDGRDLLQLTTQGDNSAPDWSKTLE